MNKDEHTYATVDTERSERMNEHSYPVCNIEPQKDNTPLGYWFNLDNLDSQIRVREITQDHQNVSRHFTQIMTIVDRVNCEHLSDEPVGHLVNIENGAFLPPVEDNYTLRKDMLQVVSNVLVESLLKCLKTFILLTSSTFIPKNGKEINCGISLFNCFVESPIAFFSRVEFI